GSPTKGILHLDHKTGKTCGLEGNYPIQGTLVAVAQPGSPGNFSFGESTLSIGVDPVAVSGVISLSTSVSAPLVLSSAASPGAAHWYRGNSTWTTLSAGGSTGFAANGQVSFDLDFPEFWGTQIEFSCAGAANSISGTLGNPTGGGAGTVNAIVTLGE